MFLHWTIGCWGRGQLLSGRKGSLPPLGGSKGWQELWNALAPHGAGTGAATQLSPLQRGPLAGAGGLLGTWPPQRGCASQPPGARAAALSPPAPFHPRPRLAAGRTTDGIALSREHP